VDWRCITIAVGDYAKRCLGACSNNWKPANGENPAAHCNRYSGKWEVTGICVEPSCSATPDFPAPSSKEKSRRTLRVMSQLNVSSVSLGKAASPMHTLVHCGLC
jgi:hypothetical protein